MKTPDTFGKTGIVVLFTAFAASLCCITPVLALIAGSAGIASAFSWLAPARPYLIGITLVVLGFAWYQKLKPKKRATDCACEKDKPSFWQGRIFLGIITLFALALLALPAYSGLFFPKQETKEITHADHHNMLQARFRLTGMTCAACEQEIKHALAPLPGFMQVSSDFKTGKVAVQFDRTKTSLHQVDSAVRSVGYPVAGPVRVHE